MKPTPRQGRLVRTRVPDGKKVLNAHVSTEEHRFLRDLARDERMTITMVLRTIIREAKARMGR